MDLSKLANALQIVNSIDPGAVYLHHLSLLISIEEAGPAGLTYADIEARHGLSNAGASRSVNALSDHARHRRKAMGLVEIFRCPDEGRRYRVRLTAKGRSVMASIKQL
ncbi:MAG: hypothetical protein CMO47_00440 [Verrucomicrobiales bacterium]|nr:hypothetical protein [Verrucomicrobiales bacterium]